MSTGSRLALWGSPAYQRETLNSLDQIHLRANEQLALREAAALLRERLPVDKIILFGSKARGDDHPESDMDLLILTQRILTDQEKDSIVQLLYPLELQYQVPFNTLDIPTEEWEHGVYQALPLRDEVERDGVLV